MATFNQRDDALRGYVSDIDVEQYGKVLIGLQAGYDKNVGELTKVDMQLKKIADTQLLNQEAKDYFFTRMRERKDVLEKNMGNFAHANELDYGMKTLYSAIDDTVATETYNSSLLGKIDEEHKKFADGKHPELANSVNLEYSKKDISAWLNTKGHLGKRFQGNSTYAPYVDQIKILNEQLKNIEPDTYATATTNGQYEIRKQNGELVRPARVKEIVDMISAANPQFAKQTEINGWNEYKSLDDNSFLEGSKIFVGQLAENYKNSAESEEAYMKGAKLLGDNATYQASARAYNYDNAHKEKYEELFKKIKDSKTISKEDRAQFETLLMDEKTKGAVAGAFAYNKVKKLDIELNPVTSWGYEQQYKANQDAITNANNDKKTQIDAYKVWQDANPGQTMSADQANALGISQNIISAFSPETTIVGAVEIPKSKDYEESIAQLDEMSNSKKQEIIEITRKLAILSGKKPSEIEADINVFNPNGKTQQQLNEGGRKHYEGIQDALKNTKNLSSEQIKLINQYNEAYEEIGAIYRVKEAHNKYKDTSNIDRTKYKYVTKDSPLKYKEGYTPELQLQEIATGKIIPVPSSNEGMKDNLHREAEKNGLTIFAAKSAPYIVKDIALITKALKAVRADDLTGDESNLTLASLKDIQEQINKNLTTKDGSPFPIRELVFEGDNIKLTKNNGEQIAVTGLSEYSTLKQMLRSYQAQVQRQKAGLIKTNRLKAKASVINSDGYSQAKTVHNPLPNGEIPISYVSKIGNTMSVKIYVGGKVYNASDSNGNSFWEISSEDANNVNLADKIEIATNAQIEIIKNNLKNGGGK